MDHPIVNHIRPVADNAPDMSLEWDVVSLDNSGEMYTFSDPPIVRVPSSGPLDHIEHPLYLAELADASPYDLMSFYQWEHFQRMQRIQSHLGGRNLPLSMPYSNQIYLH
eukprot:scaffold237158_cov43-Attheya_sp.AAC.1